MTEVDKVEFPDIKEQLIEQQKPVTDWYAQFAKAYTLNELSPIVREILYSLREGRAEKLPSIAFDILSRLDKNFESIVSVAKKKSNQALLSDLYQIVEKTYYGVDGKTIQKDLHGSTLFYWAMLLNQFELMPDLLQRYPDFLNQPDAGSTPLMLAAIRGEKNIVEFLFSQKNIQPLMTVKIMGNVSFESVDTGESIDADTGRDWTALHFSVDRGDEDIVRIFLQHVGGFQALDIGIQYSLAYVAIEKGHVALVKAFITANSVLLNHSVEQMTLFALAVSKGNDAIVNFFLEKLELSSGKNIKQLKEFFKHPQYSNENKLQIIHLAFYSGSASVLKVIAQLFIENWEFISDLRVDEKQNELFVNNWKHLLELSADNKKRLFNALQKNPYSFNQFFSKDILTKLLFIAAKEGRIELVEKLVDDIEDQASLLCHTKANGETLLFFAIKGKHTEMVIFLVRKNVMSDLEDIAKEKLLFRAVTEGYLDIVEKLMNAYPILLNTKNEDKQTALELAVYNEHISIVRFLLARPGVDVGIRQANNHGSLINQIIYIGNVNIFNALFPHYKDSKELLIDAVVKKNVLMVEFLLAQPGIDVWAELNPVERDISVQQEEMEEKVEERMEVDRKGWTALHYAVESESVEVINILLKHILTYNVFPENLVFIDCSQLDKMTGSAIALLQFIVREREAKKEMVVLHSPSLFSDHKRQAIIGLQTQTNIQAAKTLMNLIVHDSVSYQNKLAEIKDTLNNNDELKKIYDKLYEVDQKFKLVPHELTPKQ